MTTGSNLPSRQSRAELESWLIAHGWRRVRSRGPWQWRERSTKALYTFRDALSLERSKAKAQNRVSK